MGLLIIANILLIVMVLFTIFIVITVMWTILARVPFVPTPHKVVRQMIDFAELKGDEVVYDLGAGDARFLTAVKKRFPSVKAIGCEFVPTIWLLGKMRILLSRQQIDWRRGDAMKVDVSDADCIFLYLLPSFMDDLKKNFDKVLRPGTKVISYAFVFKEKDPVKDQEAPWLEGKRKVRMYQW